MRFPRRGLLGASIGVAGALAWAGSPAGAATDISPPTWSKVPAASIPLGAVLDPISGCGSDSQLHPVYVDYQAIDPESGINHYDVYTTGAIGPEDVGLVTRIQMSGWTTDPADCGGGGRPNFFAQAVNGAGLASREYGWDPRRLVVVQDLPSVDVTYTGTWAVSKATTFSAGTTRKTTQKGAAVRLRITVPTTTASPNTSALGLVMAKGPDRGSAQVWLDGLKVATVNTNSATKVNRVVVWRANLAPGAHTLRVVNLATTGHARIDVDAFVLLPKGSLPVG